MSRNFLIVLSAAALAGGWASPGASQDVEHLGEHYGTPLPDGYVRLRGQFPGSFRFRHGRAVRARALRRARALGIVGGVAAGLPARVVAPRGEGMTGTFEFPLVMGRFSDSPASMAFTRDMVQDALFGDGGNTITAYYHEVSGNRLTVRGVTYEWTPTTLTQKAVTGGESALGGGRLGDFIFQVLEAQETSDWGRFDNDGPDGVPNSGDDDGFVDVLAILHPTWGAECGGQLKDDRIWSHRWALGGLAGHAFETTAPAANGGFIRVDDYVIQPAFSCNQKTLIEIGVFSHELGHAFGLPDLYDTDKDDGDSQQGAGEWDLMASGSWGCQGNNPARPCHMGAWSKAALGWVDVVDVAPGEDLGVVTLPPVETSGRVYRVDAGDGSGEYFLLEDRQQIGFDRDVYNTGLLIWHIDPDWTAARWESNTINSLGDHLGVWLRQADGRNDLATPGRGRGDAGDPFPLAGSVARNKVFHAASNPAATSHEGTPTGTTILDIARVGEDVTFRLLTRFSNIALRTEGDESGGLLAVDGVPVEGKQFILTSAPFVPHTIEAQAGEILGPEVRRPFVEWIDAPQAGRVRDLVTPLADTELVARYGGRQVHFSVSVGGGVADVSPGGVESLPVSEDLWFDEGASVVLEAVPTTGFGFLEWTGALAGDPNPTVRTADQPLQAGALFEVTYAVSSSDITVEAAARQAVQLETENGTAPIAWSVTGGRLPEGLNLIPTGLLSGVPLEIGGFSVSVHALDARGLSADGVVTIEVSAPSVGLAALASPFLTVGPALDVDQRSFFDARGNSNGTYDLGDFRAWVLAHPALTVSGAGR